MSRARDIANYGDGIDTSSITSGTFADARIAQSNVTQHESAIDALGTVTSGTFNGTIGSSATFPAGSIVGSNFHVLTTRHAISNNYNTGSFYNDLSGWTWTKLEVSYTLKTASPVLHFSCHLCMGTSNNSERLSLKLHRVDSSGNSVAPVSGFVTSQESSRRHAHASDVYYTLGSDEHLLNFAFNTQDDLSLSAGTTVYYRVYANQNASSITLYINRPDNDANQFYIPSTVSSLKLMEIVE